MFSRGFQRTTQSVFFPRLYDAFALRIGFPRGMKSHAGDLRRGQIVSYNARPHLVLSRDQHFTGRGGSIIKVELKELVSSHAKQSNGGKRYMVRFSEQDTLDVLQLQSRACQFLYKQGNGMIHALDTESYETLEIPSSLLQGFNLSLLPVLYECFI